MTAAISVSGLVKRFGTTRALDELDLTVETGEVHGFLGPNGAGKTTTIRVLLGLLRRDAGRVRLLDGDPWRDTVRLHRRLAYVPGEVNLWPNLTGGVATMLANHHITKPVYIGEIQADGQFDVVWETPGLVVGDEWSDYLPESKVLISDWRAPMSCGNFNTATGKCGGSTTN